MNQLLGFRRFERRHAVATAQRKTARTHQYHGNDSDLGVVGFTAVSSDSSLVSLIEAITSGGGSLATAWTHTVLVIKFFRLPFSSR
jgi:hypothetical protein